MLLYRPEFRQTRESPISADELAVFQYLEDLPVHLALNGNEQMVVTASIIRMFEDARIEADTGILHTLLRNQLYALLIRLHLIQSRGQQPEREALAVQQFKRYRSAVDRECHRWHRVSDYAKLLGCS